MRSVAGMTTCFAVATWKRAGLFCSLPPGHKTLLEHFDRDRGLRWLQSGSNVTAWPGTEEDTWEFVRRVEGRTVNHQ